MLRAGKTKTPVENNPTKSSVATAFSSHSADGSDEEGTAAPSYQSSFSDAMTTALNKFEKGYTTQLLC